MRRIQAMDLTDAMLVILSESAEHPAVTSIAQSVYDRLARGEDVGYQQLDNLIGEASGKGALRALHAKYSPVAYDAILMPILAELDRQKPVPPRHRPDRENDPLLASAWPPR
jgi:hypothetical protein